MVTKPSLSKFQESLAKRLSEATSEPASTSRLGMQAGARNWLLRLEDVGEIVPVPDLTPVPLTKPWLLGLANVRGALISVVDFSLLGGGAATPRSNETRIVLTGDRWQVRSGVLVDRMLGLRAVQQMRATDQGGSTREPWAGADLLDSEGRRWTELDMRSLVTSEIFLQAGA